ncbi:DNA-binding transcriptional LysR family regulator [Agromyces sp. 3263]|uniref:LysR family transcriptional regulator n=1 Tax=Agromyces sp. 3263 TaxID=2817750 RepID=UPI00285E77D9|nr:LysR family transcriptional regulator [Agromyces sp. 3263]MDR6907102.1 DNA-binding transcriptional LysR family regulator [Agromyces sp. 3263]
MARNFDLLSACEAFVSVAEHESFTAGAVGAGVTQSVASRRIAALEAHLGGRLFERSSRRVALTAFGRGVLPSATRLVVAAQEFGDDAEQARSLPITLAVPRHLSPARAARLCAAAADGSLTVELLEGVPRERAEWMSAGRAQLALQHVEPDRAVWSTPLGVGFAGDAGGNDGSGDEEPFYLAELRPRRGTPERRRLWLQPEDDVPNVRDRLERVRNGAGLAPGHLRLATSLVAAIARAIADGDLVLCTRAEANEADLAWHPLGDLHLLRGYALVHRDAGLAERFLEATRPLLPELLGTTTTAGTATPTEQPHAH